MRRALPWLLLASAVAYGGDWSVRDTTDKMTGTVTGKSAYLPSLGTISLEFPFQGAQPVMLFVDQRSGGVTLAGLGVSRGQFECLERECKFRVRFDDGPVEDWPMQPARSVSSVIAFRRPAQIAQRIRAASRMRVEAKFFRNPYQVVEFDVSGLDGALPAATP